MRLRKPCTLLLCRFLGWYVLFILSPHFLVYLKAPKPLFPIKPIKIRLLLYRIRRRLSTHKANFPIYRAFLKKRGSREIIRCFFGFWELTKCRNSTKNYRLYPAKPGKNSTNVVSNPKTELSTIVDNSIAFCGILIKNAGFWCVFAQKSINKLWITLFFWWISLCMIHIFGKEIRRKIIASGTRVWYTNPRVGNKPCFLCYLHILCYHSPKKGSF